MPHLNPANYAGSRPRFGQTLLMLIAAAGAAVLHLPDAHAQVDNGIRFSSDTYVVTPDQDAVDITLLRPIRDTAGPGQVFYRTMNDTAREGVDFAGTSGSVNWDADDFDDKVISVPLIENTNDAETRGFHLQLTEAFGDVTLLEPSAYIEIIGEENLRPGQVRISTPDIDQVTADSYAISVVRERGAYGDARVRVRSSGGTPGADYTPIDQDVIWGDGEAGVRMVTLQGVPPFQQRSDEIRVTVSLSSPQGGVSLVDPSAVEVIFTAPDDPPPPPDPDEVSTTGFLEDTKTIPASVDRVFLLLRREGETTADRGLEVEYRVTGGTAVADVDYPATDSFGTLVWGISEQSTKSIEIPLTGERASLHTLELSLSANGDQIDPTRETVTVTIEAAPEEPGTEPPEEPDAGLVSFTRGSLTLPSTAAEAFLTFQRTKAAADDELGPLAVEYNVVDGNTAPSVDYDASASFGRIDYASGETGIRGITIPIVQRNTGSPRTFQVSLTTEAAGNPQTVDVTILPPADAPPDETEADTVGFATSTMTVAGSAPRVVTFIERKPGTTNALSISYRPDGGTALADVDYAADSAIGTITWAEGESGARMIEVPLLRPLPEARTLTLTLLGDEDVLINALRSQTITIQQAQPTDPGEQPTPGSFSFLTGALAVASDAPQITTLVERTGTAPLTAETIDWRVIDGTTNAGVDYPGEFSAGQIEWGEDEAGLRPIQIPINPATASAPRSLTIELRTALAGDIQSQTVTIASPDAVDEAGVVEFTRSVYRVPSSANTLSIPVRRHTTGDRADLEPAMVDYQVIDDSSQVGVDYDPTQSFGTLSWASAETGFKTIDIDLSPTREQEVRFTVRLDGDGVDPAASTSTIVIIVEPTELEDPPQPGLVEMESASIGVGASAGVATAGITRYGGADGEMNVTVIVAYPDGRTETASVSWGDGESGTRLIIIDLPDVGFGEDQIITVGIADATGGRVGGQTTTRLKVEIADGAGALSGLFILIMITAVRAWRRRGARVLRAG